MSAILIVLLLGGGTLFLWHSGFFHAFSSVGELQDYIASFEGYPYLIFFLLQYLSVILAPIPSNISAAAGGLLFGTLPAFLLTFGAVLAGSVTVFLLARNLGRSFADRFVSRHLAEKYRTLIDSKTTTFLTLAFLFPFFPDDVLCILAGLTSIPLKKFFLIALCARPWGLLVASAVGGSTINLPPWAMALIGLAGAALFLAGMKYGTQLRERIIAWIRGPAPEQEVSDSTPPSGDTDCAPSEKEDT